MDRHIVGILVASKKLTRESLERAIGVALAHGVDRGEVSELGDRYPHSTWRLSSGLRPGDGIERSLAKYIYSRWPTGAARRVHRLDPKSRVVLTISALYSTFTSTVVIPAGCVKWAAREGLAIEVSTYPIATKGSERRPLPVRQRTGKKTRKKGQARARRK